MSLLFISNRLCSSVTRAGTMLVSKIFCHKTGCLRRHRAARHYHNYVRLRSNFTDGVCVSKWGFCNVTRPQRTQTTSIRRSIGMLTVVRVRTGDFRGKVDHDCGGRSLRCVRDMATTYQARYKSTFTWMENVASLIVDCGFLRFRP